MTCGGDVRATVAKALMRYAIDGERRDGFIVIRYRDKVAEWCDGETCYTAKVTRYPTIEMDSPDGKIRAEFWLLRSGKVVFGCWVDVYPSTPPGYYFNCIDKECPTDVVMEGLRRLGL